MNINYRVRRRLSVLVLFFGLPVYIIGVVTLINTFDRFPTWIEMLVYLAAGIAWVLPCRNIFLGIGQKEPNENI